MTVDIQFDEMPFSETLTYFATQKLEDLAEKYRWILKANVYYKTDNDPSQNDKICEIGLNIPGHYIYASSRHGNFGIATRKAIMELEEKLKNRILVLKAR